MTLSFEDTCSVCIWISFSVYVSMKCAINSSFLFSYIFQKQRSNFPFQLWTKVKVRVNCACFVFALSSLSFCGIHFTSFCLLYQFTSLRWSFLPTRHLLATFGNYCHVFTVCLRALLRLVRDLKCAEMHLNPKCHHTPVEGETGAPTYCRIRKYREKCLKRLPSTVRTAWLSNTQHNVEIELL